MKPDFKDCVETATRPGYIYRKMIPSLLAFPLAFVRCAVESYLVRLVSTRAHIV